MSDREDHGWFCPRCVEYDRNLPTIYPDSTAHPAFYEDLEENRDRLIGTPVEFSMYGTDGTSYLGTVETFDEDVVEIVREGDGPFDEVSRRLETERFLELLDVPGEGSLRDNITTDEDVFICV